MRPASAPRCARSRPPAPAGTEPPSPPPAPAAAAATRAGMDRFAVLVFRDQRIDDEQQLAFSRHFGPLEQAISHGIDREQQRGLAIEIAAISNLGRQNEILAREDRRRLFS